MRRNEHSVKSSDRVELGEYICSIYPLVGVTVDGRVIRDSSNVPNVDSIAASVLYYDVLPGLREVRMVDFELTGKHYSVKGNNRIRALQGAIAESNEIAPLIVVVDEGGPYILEGATRADALYNLGAKSFPALVVIDVESP